MMKINTTFPAAFASAHSASIASGSSTSWTQRGTTTRGGCADRTGGASVSSRSCSPGGSLGACSASGAFSETPLICLPPSPEYG